MPFEDYTKLRKLGQGSFGSIYLVQDKRNRKPFVMKEVDLSTMNEQGRQEALKEVKFLAQLNHPNIISYQEFFEKDIQAGRGKRKRVLYIIMEYADGGDLSARIKKQRGPFPESQVVDWLTQICLCLKHMHDRKILHRDIKSENVFLMKDSVVKLGDFGISKNLASTFALAHTRIGTPYYLSPEICLNKPYDSKNDMWALGVVMYEAMTLKHPFDADSMEKLLDKIVRGRPAPLPRSYSPQLRDVVEWLLKKDPRKRPSVHELLRQPFIKEQVGRFLSPDIQKEEFSHTILHSDSSRKMSMPGQGKESLDKELGMDNPRPNVVNSRRNDNRQPQAGRRRPAADRPRTPRRMGAMSPNRHRKPPPSPKVGIPRVDRDRGGYQPSAGGNLGAGGADMGMSIGAAPWREDRDHLGSRRGRGQQPPAQVARREREDELAKIRHKYFKERKEARERAGGNAPSTPTRNNRHNGAGIMSPGRNNHNNHNNNYNNHSNHSSNRRPPPSPHRANPSFPNRDHPDRRDRRGGNQGHDYGSNNNNFGGGGGGDSKHPFPAQARPGRRRQQQGRVPPQREQDDVWGGGGVRASPRYGRRNRRNSGGNDGLSDVGKALYRAMNK